MCDVIQFNIISGHFFNPFFSNVNLDDVDDTEIFYIFGYKANKKKGHTLPLSLFLNLFYRKKYKK